LVLAGINSKIQTLFSAICVFFAHFPSVWRKTGALALRQQVFFTDQQITERSQQVQPVAVFRQAAMRTLL